MGQWRRPGHARDVRAWDNNRYLNMNFKHPSWLVLYTTLGMLLLGYFGFLYTSSYWADKAADRGWWTLIGLIFGFLLIFGALGVVVSLFWCLAGAIAPRRETNEEEFRRLLDEHRKGHA